MSACKSCGAEIMWLTNKKTTKAVPVDREPAAAGMGNVRVFGKTVVVVGKGEGTHVLHFATCPNAASHRRPKS